MNNKKALYHEMDTHNFKAALPASIVTVLLEAFMIFSMSSYARSAAAGDFPWINAHMLSYIINLSVSLLVCIYSIYFLKNKEKQRNHFLPMAVIVLYSVMLLCFGMYIGVSDHHDNILPYLVMKFGVTALFIFSPYILLPLSMGSGAFYFYLLVSNQLLHPSSHINFFIIELFCVLIGLVRYYQAKRTVSGMEEIQALNAQLEEYSFQDSLTKMKNRRNLSVDFAGYLNRDLYIVMADVDQFKGFNDTYGHHAGDTVLQVVAEQLMKKYPKQYLYRYGGDEFLMLIPQNEVKESALAKFDGISFTTKVDSQNIDIHMSCGVIEGNAVDEDALRELIKSADRKLYEQKYSSQ